mmetsp:Transcript_17849/g.48542  ORF Transcript_17849/g.48542 Transcript_17849/m.48542 type:complete len:117 (+) Transcript_17849:46-396(+)
MKTGPVWILGTKCSTQANKECCPDALQFALFPPFPTLSNHGKLVDLSYLPTRRSRETYECASSHTKKTLRILPKQRFSEEVNQEYLINPHVSLRITRTLSSLAVVFDTQGGGGIQL